MLIGEEEVEAGFEAGVDTFSLGKPAVGGFSGRSSHWCAMAVYS